MPRGEARAATISLSAPVGRLDVVALRTVQRPGIHVHGRGPRWDLALARDLPLRLDVRTAIADTTLDLRGTRVRTLDAVSEMGRQVVYLPDEAMNVTISADMGAIEVHLPRDANASIAVRPGLRRVDAAEDFVATRGGYALHGGGFDIDVRVATNVGTVSLRTD